MRANAPSSFVMHFSLERKKERKKEERPNWYSVKPSYRIATLNIRLFFFSLPLFFFSVVRKRFSHISHLQSAKVGGVGGVVRAQNQNDEKKKTRKRIRARERESSVIHRERVVEKERFKAR